MVETRVVSREASLKSHTEYMTFDTDERREFVRITDEVQAAVEKAGESVGMVLRLSHRPAPRACG